MALPPRTGWTSSTLLPSIASGFSAGATVGSRAALAQSSPNPGSIRNALAGSRTANSTRVALMNRILGKTQPEKQEPARQPNANPAVNSFSSQGFSTL